MLRYLWTAAAAAVALAGCYSVDDLRQRPVAWSATYSIPFDTMANCLAGQWAGATTVTPLIYQREQRAFVTLSNVPDAFGEYEITTRSATTITVSYRQRMSVIGDTTPARVRADRCGRA